MLCQALKGILPPLSQEEALTVYKIQNIAGQINAQNFIEYLPERPFRAPHHTATLAAIIGGGSRIKPGEITLAHHGVLFFDECNRFNSSILEALREPLEQGSIRLSRNNMSLNLPANFIFAAAINPCPCGNWGSPNQVCTCTAIEISRFTKKLSAPILDRIELQVLVEKNPGSLLDNHEQAESSAEILTRVIKAREFRKQRKNSGAEISFIDLDKSNTLTNQARDFVKKAAINMNLSNRELLRLINVARSVADLRQSEKIELADIATAITFRIQI
jgi:magnesium chelatase family protein